MSIPTINKPYALSGGINVSTFSFSGKNVTKTYTNANTYSVYAIVTITGGLGVQNNTLTNWGTNWGTNYYTAGYTGCAITCKLNNVVIDSCTGGRGNAQTTYQTRWNENESQCYRCFFSKCSCRRQVAVTKYSGTFANDKAYSGQVKSFMLTIKPNETLSFVIDNQAGGNAQFSVSILQ